MNLVTHKGKLYAGIGYWEDVPSTDPMPGPQILVLDSPGGQWRLEHAFSEEFPSGRPRFRRISALKVITFTTDHQGHLLSQPVSMLVAGVDAGRGWGAVFSRNDETGEWTKFELGMKTFRCLALYKDLVTGVDRVFVGGGGYQKGRFHGGIFGGVYDPSAPGHIRWDEAPEFTKFRNRPMAFVECNGRLFFAAKPKLYKRTTNGPNPKWSEVYSYPDRTRRTNSGLRGLTVIPNPRGSGQVILAALEGKGSKILQIDPTTGHSPKIELDIDRFLTKQWGRRRHSYVIAAYNDMVLAEDQATSEFVYLIGLQAHCPLRGKENSAWYLVRDAKAHYSLHEIRSIAHAELGPSPKLVGVRAITVSPFAEDAGQVLYFGGYDSNFLPAHNTAWLYRVGLRTALFANGGQLDRDIEDKKHELDLARISN